MSKLLTISYGDTPTGPALLEAVLQQMADAGAVFEIEVVQLGAEMEKLGFEQGFDNEVLNKIRRARVLLKAPTEKDVTTALQQELGDDCAIFEPTVATAEAMLQATLAMLEHMQQPHIAEILRGQ